MSFIAEMGEFSQSILVKSYTAGAWVDGLYVEGTQSSVAINAIIQPMDEKTLLMAPEGFRADESLLVKTDNEIAIQSKVEISGVDYLVLVSKNWMSIFPHWVHMCEKVRVQL